MALPSWQERGDFDGVAEDERGLNQLRFDHFESLDQGLADTRLLFLNAERGQFGVGFLDALDLAKIDAVRGELEIAFTQPHPRLGESAILSVNCDSSQKAQANENA